MRDLALEEQAGLIYCPFRALLHLPTWAHRRARTFERVAGSLRPGGRFAWNALRSITRLRHSWTEPQVEPLAYAIQYAVGDNRIDIVLDDGSARSLWWTTKNEWLGLLDVAGFELEALFGGFDKSRSTTIAANTSLSPVAERQRSGKGYKPPGGSDYPVRTPSKLELGRETGMTTAHLIHGYLCAGKTTVAKELERKLGAVRFSPDETMISLYGGNPLLRA